MILQFKMHKAAIIVLLLGMVGKMYAYDFSAVCETGQTLYYNIIDAENLYVELTYPMHYNYYDPWGNYTKPTGYIILPNQIEYESLTYSVKSIGERTFYECSGLTDNLSIPNSVTSIGNSAFINCYLLSTITIPNSVNSIGSFAFSNCHGLTSLTIPNSVTMIDSYAFDNCDGLSSITIPYSVTSIGEGAFSFCSGLEQIIVELGNMVYDSRENCNAVIETNTNRLVTGCKNTVIPNSVTKIGNRAFSGSGLASITIPNSVTLIGESAFEGCMDLASVNLNTSLSSIPNYAFAACNNLYSIKLPNSINTIGEGAFGGSGLCSIIIPNSVTTIGGYAFGGSPNLSRVVLGNSIETIAGDAFDMCDVLTKVISLSETPPAIEWPGFNSADPYITLSSKTLYVPANSVNVYQNASVWNEFDNILPMTIIDNLVFSYNDTDFTSSVIGYVWELSEQVSVPSTITIESVDYTVTSIGEAAFSSNTELISIDIPNTVVSIEDKAFGGCKGISSIIIPGSVVSIGEEAFRSCTNMTSIILPNSITSIGAWAFVNCNNLTSISLPNSITTISSYAFGYCSSLISVNIPNSVTQIMYNAFIGCTGLSSITIPNSVDYIGLQAFRWCNSLVAINVLSELPPSLFDWSSGATFGYTNNCPIYVPYEFLNDYKTSTNWSNYEDRIFPMAYITIPAYNESSNNWHFIASPLIDSIAPTVVDNMTTESVYDLYQFNPFVENGQWDNYKTDSFNLVNGKGYLYANASEVNVIFKGEFNDDGTKVIELVYNESNPTACWNLVGNPFPVSAYINKPYYVMNEDGTNINPEPIPATVPVPACTAVFVKATVAGDTVVFTVTAP